MEKWEIIELYMEADEETKQQIEMLLTDCTADKDYNHPQ